MTCSCCSDRVSAAGKTVGSWPQPFRGGDDGPARLPVCCRRPRPRQEGDRCFYQAEKRERKVSRTVRRGYPRCPSPRSTDPYVAWCCGRPGLRFWVEPGTRSCTAYCGYQSILRMGDSRVRSRPDSGLCNGHQSVRRWGQQTPAKVAPSPFCPRECEKRLSRSCGDGTLV